MNKWKLNKNHDGLPEFYFAFRIAILINPDIRNLF